MLENAATVFDSLQAIGKVERLIDAIGAVSSSSGGQIKAARDAYEALTWEQQKQVGNYSVLQNAEHAYEALQNPPVIPEPKKETEPEQPGQGTGGAQVISAGGSDNPDGSADTAGNENAAILPETEAERELHQEDGYDGAAETEEAIPDWLKEELERNGITEDGGSLRRRQLPKISGKPCW